MTERYDVAVIGGHFDGLVTAAYLAKAGRSVVVLEPTETLGGPLATTEIAPGYRAPATLGTVELLHPSVVAELGLDSHGLEIVAGDGVLLPSTNAPSLHLDPDRGTVAGQIAAWSSRDAAAYEQFERFHGRVAAALAPALTARLPGPEPKGIGDAWDLLKLGWRLRRLGADEMPEALRYLPMPIRDVLDERFETESLRAVLAAPALEASWLGPRSAGSAFGLIYHRPAWVQGLVPPAAFVRGSTGRLIDAVAAAVRGAGGEIRTGVGIQGIAVRAGRAGGVDLADGTTLRAARVASCFDPKRTLLGLVSPEWLDPEDLHRVRSIRGRGSASFVRFAVDRKPPFDGPSDGDRHLAGRIQIAATLDDLERAYDAAKYGRIPEAPWIEITIPTVVDPALAPAGHHVVAARVQFTPYALRDGSWSEEGAALGERVTTAIEALAPGFTQSIVARDVVTPVDIEARWGLTGGCLYHVDMTLDQLLYMRPVAGWFDYDTPVDGLFLCGPGGHPGGGITGLPGRNAARRILAGLSG